MTTQNATTSVASKLVVVLEKYPKSALAHKIYKNILLQEKHDQQSTKYIQLKEMNYKK